MMRTKSCQKSTQKIFYKDDEPSKKTEFKRDIELGKTIFEYLRT